MNDPVVQGIVEYFCSDHWRRLGSALQEPDPHNAHIHIYVDTSIHPQSLEKAVCSYFALKGWPSARRIDHMSPRPGMGSLHGIEPQGKPHFDLNWFYRADVILAPSEGGENGSNLLVWNRWYSEEFYGDFDFRPVGPAEEAQLREYFQSSHWHRGLEMAILPTTNHLHINVYTSVHPNVLKALAEESIRAKGWGVYYTCPNVYLVEGKYTGKLVFMGRQPEAVYDLGWRFNPGVIIEPARDVWIWEANPGYDIWTSAMLEEVMQHPFVELSEGQLQGVTGLLKQRLR